MSFYDIIQALLRWLKNSSAFSAKMAQLYNSVYRKRTTAAVAKALDRAAKDIWQNGDREALHQYWIEEPPTAKELICLISARLWADRQK